MKTRVVLVGGGGHAGGLIDILRVRSEIDIVGYTSQEEKGELYGITRLGDDRILKDLPSEGVSHACIALGAVDDNSHRRRKFQECLSYGFDILKVVHPSAIVETSAELDVGVQIMAGAIVGTGSKIGKNVIVNSGAIVSHDCTISDHVHITPGAILAADVQIGLETTIGMGVTIFRGLKIGRRCVIGSGVDLFGDVADDNYVKPRLNS